PAVKDELQAYFSDNDNLRFQAFSLLIQRRFASGTGKENLGTQLGNVGTSTATELLFNQFNTLLSSLNLNFVDINVQSLNEASASFKFFNDRIMINAGIVDNTKSATDYSVGFKGDVGREVEIVGLIKKDGTLVGKLANKPPTQQSVFANPGVDQSQNVTSLGMIYTQQFDSFKEFIQKITGQYRREQKRKEAEKAQKEKLDKEAILNETKKNEKRKR
ncbi:MAG: translocation/assembly module TamB domain-containing protein, partial [Pedobacter sp.]|nr:translocation/assembly module TamB domain-containing protein [Pedobacter sp.]